MEYKVLIPSAGLGSRLGDSYKNLNKALVSINNKPVISHLIEKFPHDIEIIVALGHQGGLLKEYLEIVHKDRNIKLVEIDNYCGIGSGLGYTILKCKEFLNCPFLFCPNDTFILDEIPLPDINWVGYSNVNNDLNYRSLKINVNKVVEDILNKDNNSRDLKPYIGLAGIKDFEAFWDAMEHGKNYGAINVGEAYAIKKLIDYKYEFIAREFKWFDTGNLKSLENAKEILKKEDSPEILEKHNEAIWFVSGKVVKYNHDKKFISDRIERGSLLEDYVPLIIDKGKNMYSYNEVTGQVFSKVSNKLTFSKLLKFLDKFWKPVNLNKTQKNSFYNSCLDFYKLKTEKRVNLYFDRFSEEDNTEIINGYKVPTIKNLLSRLDWNVISKGIPTRFHGDLHFENILVTETGEFCLLDWRENFSGLKQYGDIYYDLAKILHGIIISHQLINEEKFSIDKNEDLVKFDFNRKQKLVENEKEFIGFLKEKNFDIKKVHILTALIFINIAPLHHYPYSELLFYLGKESLFKITEKKTNFELL